MIPNLEVLLAGCIGALSLFVLGLICDSLRDQRETHSLLRLVQAEADDNIRLAEMLLHKPEFITRLLVAFKDELWKETRVRLARLLPDENHFDILNAFYANIATLKETVRLQASEANETDNPANRIASEALTETLLEELQKTMGLGRDVQSVVLSYIPPNRMIQHRTFEEVEQEVDTLVKQGVRQQIEKEKLTKPRPEQAE